MYVTRGFIASTRAFNLLTLAFNLPTRAFNLVTRAFNLATRAFSLLTREFELVTRGFELVTCGYELVTRNSYFTFPLSHRIGNACVFPSISHDMGKDSQTHQMGKTWENWFLVISYKTHRI